MNKEIVHAVVLIFSVIIGFVLPNTFLIEYDIQIVSVLFIILFATKKYFITPTPYSRLTESVIFTLVVIGVVNSTGGTASPFFFLVYFLLFSLSLILEPIIPIIVTLSIITLYLLAMPENQSLEALIPLISIAFLTPFALFMAREHIEAKKSKSENSRLKEDTFLFLSLMIKNHLKTIRQAIDNYVGDHQLDIIKKSASRMEKLIEKFEKSQNG